MLLLDPYNHITTLKHTLFHIIATKRTTHSLTPTKKPREHTLSGRNLSAVPPEFPAKPDTLAAMTGKPVSLYFYFKESAPGRPSDICHVSSHQPDTLFNGKKIETSPSLRLSLILLYFRTNHSICQSRISNHTTHNIYNLLSFVIPFKLTKHQFYAMVVIVQSHILEVIHMNRMHLPYSWEKYLDRKLTTSVFKYNQIIDLIIPGVLDSLSIMFINALITALISSNGETSVAAVSLCGPITTLIGTFFMGLSDGGGITVSQSYGKGDERQLKKAIGMTVWLPVAVGAVFCLPFLIAPEPILHIIYPQMEAEVMHKAGIYLAGCTWSILPYTLFTALFRILRGLGEPKRCLYLSIIINVAYLLFSILFLNVLHMDINGSVTALILARVVGAGFAVMYLFLWKPPVKMKFKEIFCFDNLLLKANLKISLPLGLEQAVMSLAGLISQMVMTTLGTTAIAINAIANSMMGLLWAPTMSIGSLSVTVVGRCIGAGKKEEAYMYGKRCNSLAILMLIASALIFYPLMPVLMQQYHPSAEAAPIVRTILLASLPFLVFAWPTSYTMPSTLRSASDSLFPTIVSMSVLWVVSVGLSYLLAIVAGLGLWGVWIANWTGWTVRTALFMYRFRSKKWLDMATVKAKA